MFFLKHLLPIVYSDASNAGTECRPSVKKNNNNRNLVVCAPKPLSLAVPSDMDKNRQARLEAGSSKPKKKASVVQVICTLPEEQYGR